MRRKGWTRLATVLCHDAWEDQYEEIQEQAIDGDGNLLWDEQPQGDPLPRVNLRRVLTIPAGSRYGVRYDELLVLIMAAERRQNDDLERRLVAIEPLP